MTNIQQFAHNEASLRRSDLRLDTGVSTNLFELSETSRYSSVRELYGMYYLLGEKVRGARVVVPRDLRTHIWALEALSELEIVALARGLPLSEALSTKLAARASEQRPLGHGTLYLHFVDGADAYVFVQKPGKKPEIHFLPISEFRAAGGTLEPNEEPER